MHKPGMVSIWFLIGILLTAYGLIITATGLYEYFVPPAVAPVLSNLHAGLWWGLFILVLGCFYCWRFRGAGASAPPPGFRPAQSSKPPHSSVEN